MVQKFIRTLFVLFAYLGIVASGQCSGDPGFYSEYGRVDYVAHLRGLPADEREARMTFWAVKLVAPELRRFAEIYIPEKDEEAYYLIGMGKTPLDASVFVKLRAQRVVEWTVDPCTATLEGINGTLRRLANNYHWGRGGEWVTTDHAGRFKHTERDFCFTALDTLMHKALVMPLAEVKASLVRF